jgi:hypothetical protein
MFHLASPVISTRVFPLFKIVESVTDSTILNRGNTLVTITSDAKTDSTILNKSNALVKIIGDAK